MILIPNQLLPFSTAAIGAVFSTPAFSIPAFSAPSLKYSLILLIECSAANSRLFRKKKCRLSVWYDINTDKITDNDKYVLTELSD